MPNLVTLVVTLARSRGDCFASYLLEQELNYCLRNFTYHMDATINHCITC